MVFANQGAPHPGMALFFEGLFVVNAGIEAEAADTFCKLVQYIFEWINNYVEENDVRDKSGKKFN